MIYDILSSAISYLCTYNMIYHISYIIRMWLIDKAHCTNMICNISYILTCAIQLWQVWYMIIFWLALFINIVHHIRVGDRFPIVCPTHVTPHVTAWAFEVLSFPHFTVYSHPTVQRQLGFKVQSYRYVVLYVQYDYLFAISIGDG